MAQSEKTIGNDLGLRNVLIARFSALGDVAMTIPVVYSLCEGYPQVRFVLVTRPSMTGVFVNAPANLVVVGADLKTEYAGMAGWWRLMTKLTDEYQLDALVDLHDQWRTQIMRLCARLKGLKVVKLNKGLSHKRALTRTHNKVMLPLNSSRERYREAFFKCGFPIQMTFKGLYGPDNKAADETYIHITGQAKPQGQYWIGIAPFAAFKGKVYPYDKMEQVISHFASRGDCRIFLFGSGGEEQAQAEIWCEKYARVTSLAGKKYGFPAELGLFNHLDVMLTMDSANMHLAAIAGTRTVSIWGATHFYCGFKGWHQSENDMIQVPLSCRPCSVFGEKTCLRHDMLCMKAIRPESVIQKIESILNEPRI